MPFYVIVIIASFFASILGLFTTKGNRQQPLIFFPFFLLLSISVEYIGDKMAAQNRNTAALYNFFTIFEFAFYLFFFRFLFKSKTIKQILIVTIVCYLIISLSNVFFFQGRKTFHTYTYILGCMLVVTFSVIYFYFLLRLPDTNTILTMNPYFWIVSGLMFYYTCTFSLYGLENFIISTIQRYNATMFFIADFLNVLLYSLFSIGLLCRINIRKLLASS